MRSLLIVRQSLALPLGVLISTAFILSMVQWKVERPMLLLERFWPVYGGWVEIVFISAYSAVVASKMSDPLQSARWRRITWTIFSLVFFFQLLLGLIGFERFLMTGKLHLPVPAMILAGPVFRAEIGFMPLLFISTVILSGPAWCSQLCYFGALDAVAAQGKTRRKPFKQKSLIKYSLLSLVIVVALGARLLGMDALVTTLLAGTFGVIGLLLILYVSRRQRRMVHCVLYCPVGTLLSHLKFINPFRMSITSTCNLCMACTAACKYDALSLDDIKSGKPGLTCTWCGDCLPTCRQNSIRYHFLRLSPDASRKLWIGVTITLHAVFLALARI